MNAFFGRQQQQKRLTQELKASLDTLKHDVASSIRICSRDFALLGNELLGALRQKETRYAAISSAFSHEQNERERLQAQVLELQGNIRVICRVRPPLRQEKNCVVQVTSSQELSVFSPTDGALYKSFAFYRVMNEASTQSEVFEEVAPLVNAAVDGFHACIFAYGQTGAGKTYTMQGPPSDRGVYFRAASLVFERLKAQEASFSFECSLQMVEIYNEDVRDLLSGDTTQVVEIRHNEHGVYLKNASSIPITTPNQVFLAIERGSESRNVHATNQNAHSSRSHSVLLLDIVRTSRLNGTMHNGRLVLVDLAGSERLSKTEATGMRLKEAQHINKSLSAIGDVMSALLAKEKHIPFRNSKLTHLLQDSLGRQNKALMLVQVSPIASDVNETINSLKFASRVSHIQLGQAQRSEKTEIARLHSIIATQATQLEALQEKLRVELELRKKYEKRMEEYRQEEYKRRVRDDDQHRKPSSTSSLLPSFQALTTSTVDQSVPAYMTRRWSMYTKRGEERTALVGKKPHPKNTAASGQENVSANIVTAETMPVRRSKRLSLLGSSGKSLKESAEKPLKRRKEAHDTPLRSILKKQCVMDRGGTKQVSFDVAPTVIDPETTVTPLRSVHRHSVRKSVTSSGGLGPAARVKTPTLSSAFSVPAARVLTASSSSSSASSGSGRKPKWNGGWR